MGDQGDDQGAPAEKCLVQPLREHLVGHALLYGGGGEEVGCKHDHLPKGRG